MNLNSEFEIWFKSFSENQNNLTGKSVKEMLEIAFKDGFKKCEENTPLYAKTDDGVIVEIPREYNESNLEKGEKQIDEDFDVDEWLTKRKEEKNAKE